LIQQGALKCLCNLEVPPHYYHIQFQQFLKDIRHFYDSMQQYSGLTCLFDILGQSQMNVVHKQTASCWFLLTLFFNPENG
jgi:hypothetical protein